MIMDGSKEQEHRTKKKNQHDTSIMVAEVKRIEMEHISLELACINYLLLVGRKKKL